MIPLYAFEMLLFENLLKEFDPAPSVTASCTAGAVEVTLLA
jgi:hypothetical protein